MTTAPTTAPSATSGAPPIGSLRLAASGMALIAVTYGIARFAYGLFVPAFREEFGLGAAAAGLIASGSYAAYCAAIAASMLLSGRFAPRRVAVAAGALATTGTTLVAVAPSPSILALGFLIGGASTGLASPPLAEAVAHRVSPSLRDRVQNVVNAGTGVGVAVSGPVALLVGAQWRPAWLAFAVLALAATLWAARTVPPGPTRPGGPAGAGGTRSVLAGLLPAPLLRPGAGRMLTAAAAMGGAASAVWTFGRELAVAEAGLGPTASVAMWIVLGAAGTLGAFTGELASRVGLRRAWALAMPALAAATAAPALAPVLAPAAAAPAAFAAAALFGAVYTALTGLLLLWGTRLYPDAPSFGVGAAFLMIAAGQTAGAPLAGLAADTWSLTAAFALAAVAAALGALIRPRAGARR
ncbi:MFS transporter [Nocardiopsis sp. RSe5-2]|uniref:MFS transporter n=1 Tax=Nocardiopsis endophytica TaxID=3018445 RepID=A0ABT4U338_9ACTN|nr:MFS transporter [Nocardiopsis endophytica]MDA2811372.1 MFS transporter [Nocardiopsis endophytica]